MSESIYNRNTRPTGIDAPPTAAGAVDVYMKRTAVIRDNGKTIGLDEEQAQVWERNSRMLRTVAPRLTSNPFVLSRFMQDPFLLDRIAEVRDAERYVAARAQLYELDNMPTEHQQLVWDKMDERRRMAFTGQGYVPPSERREAASTLPFLEDAIAGGLDVVGAGLQAAGTVYDAPFKAIDHFTGGELAEHNSPIDLAKDTLGLLMGAQNVLFTTHRASKYLANDPEYKGILTLLSNPKHALDVWEAAWDGEDFYEPGFREKVTKQYKPEFQRLIFRLLAGDTPENMARDYGQMGTPEYAEAFRAIQQLSINEDVQATMAEAATKNYSIGRGAAHYVGLDPTHGWGLVLSGAVDAMSQLALDPTLVAGRVRKAQQLAKWAALSVEDARTVKELADIPKWVKPTGTQVRSVSRLKNLYSVPDGSGQKLVGSFIDAQRQAEGLVSDPLAKGYYRDLRKLRPNGQKLTQAQRMLVVLSDHIVAANKGENIYQVKGYLAQLHRHHPGSEVFSNALLRESDSPGRAISSIDEMAEYLHGMEGITKLANKSWASPYAAQTLVPRLTTAGMARSRLLAGTDRAIEWMADQSNVVRLRRQADPSDFDETFDFDPWTDADFDDYYRWTGVAFDGKDSHSGHGIYEWLGEKDLPSNVDLTDPAVIAEFGDGLMDGLDERIRRLWDQAEARGEGVTTSPETLGDAAADLVALRAQLVRMGVKAPGPQPNLELVNGRRRIADWGQLALSKAGNGLVHLTRHVTYKNFIAFDDDEAITIVRQLLDMGVRGRAKDMLYDQFILARTAAERRMVVTNIYRSVLDNTGVLHDPDWKSLADEFLYNLDQRYGEHDLLDNTREAIANVSGDVDADWMRFAPGSPEFTRPDTILEHARRIGIFPRGHRADALPVIDFRTLHAAIKRHRMEKMLSGVVNNPVSEQLMKYWKRAVVFRLAFVPRAGGEELLSQVGRYGFGHLLHQFATVPLGAKDRDVPLSVVRKVRDQHAMLFGDKLDDAAELALQDIPAAKRTFIDKFSWYLRGVAGSQVSTGDNAAYEMLAEQHYVQDAVLNLHDSSLGLSSNPTQRAAGKVGIGSNVGVAGSLVHPEVQHKYHVSVNLVGGEEAIFVPSGKWGIHERNMATFLPAFGMRLAEIRDDPAARVAALVLSLRMNAADVEDVSLKLVDGGFALGIGRQGNVMQARRTLAKLPRDVRRAVEDYIDGKVVRIPGEDEDFDFLADALRLMNRKASDGEIDAEELAHVEALLNTLPRLTTAQRRMLSATADDLLAQIDTSAAYFYSGGDDIFFSGSPVEIEALPNSMSLDEMIESGRVKPVAWSGPAFYIGNSGEYGHNYALPLRSDLAGHLAVNPTMHRFVVKPGQSLRMLDGRQLPNAEMRVVGDSIVQIMGDLAESLGVNIGRRDEAGAFIFELPEEVSEAAVTFTDMAREILEQLNSGEGWGNAFGAVSRLYEASLTAAREAGAEPGGLGKVFTRSYKRHVIDPLVAKGWDGVVDHGTQNELEAFALWSTQKLRKGGAANINQLELQAENARTRTTQLLDLVARAEAGDERAYRDLSEMLVRDVLTRRDYIDDTLTSDLAGPLNGVTDGPAAHEMQLFVPMLSPDDARAVAQVWGRADGGVGAAFGQPAFGMEPERLGASVMAPVAQAGAGAEAVRTALLTRLIDPEFAEFLATNAQTAARSGLMPAVRFASSSSDEAEALMARIAHEAREIVPPERWRVGVITVSRKEAAKYRTRSYDVPLKQKRVPTSDLEDWTGGTDFAAVEGAADIARARAVTPVGRGKAAHSRSSFDPSRGTTYWLPEHLAVDVPPLDPNVPTRRLLPGLNDDSREALRTIANWNERGVMGRSGAPMVTPLSATGDDDLLRQSARALDEWMVGHGSDDMPLTAPWPWLLPKSQRQAIAEELAETYESAGLDDAVIHLFASVDDDTAYAIVGGLPISEAVNAGLDDLSRRLNLLRLDPDGEDVGLFSTELGQASLDSFRSQISYVANEVNQTMDPDTIETMSRWADEWVGRDWQETPFGRHLLGDDMHDPFALVQGKSLSDAVDEMSRRIVDEVEARLAPEGTVLHEYAVPVGNGYFNPGRHLKDPDMARLPSSITGPELKPLEGLSRSERWTNGAYGWLNRGVAAMSRTPLFRREFATSYDEMYPYFSTLLMPRALREKAIDALGVDLNHAWRVLRRVDEGIEDRRLVEAMDDEALLANLRAGGIEVDPKNLRVVRSWWEKERAVREHTAEIANTSAVRQTIPYIDNQHVRSQLAEMLRNVVPFYFAEEAFYKRWVRTMIHSPEAAHRISLAHSGLKNVGWVQTNEHGEDYYVVPGSAQLVGALGRIAELFPGPTRWTLPMQAYLTGQVQQSAPGFERIGIPAPGPLVGVGLRFLRQINKDMALGLETALVGEAHAGRSLPDLVVPTTAMRAFRAIVADEETLAANTIAAMQYMEANHPEDVPQPGASPEEVDAYIEDLNNHSRILAGARTLLGFVAPASPQVDLDLEDVNQDLVAALQAGLNPEQAVADFLRDNPGAEAFTVFKSTVESYAPARATRDALAFIDANEAFIEKYRYGAAWLLPATDNPEEFFRPAYLEMLALGIRRKKGAKEMYEDIKFAEGAAIYFKEKKKADQLKAQATSPLHRKAVTEAFRLWATDFKDTHRIFAQQLENRDSGQRREEALRQVRIVTHLPEDKRPKGVGHIDELRTMVDQWDSMQRALEQNRGSTTKAETTRKALRIAFHMWAEDHGERHPTVGAFYQRVLMPELDLPIEVELADEAA